MRKMVRNFLCAKSFSHNSYVLFSLGMKLDQVEDVKLKKNLGKDFKWQLEEIFCENF